MSPWVVFEWAASISLSVVLIVGVIFGITIGARYIIGKTSTSNWFKKK